MCSYYIRYYSLKKGKKKNWLTRSVIYSLLGGLVHYRSCRKRHLTTAHGLAGLATGTYIPFLHEYRHLDGTGASIVCRTYTSYILFSLSIPVSFCILCILPPRSHSHALSKRLFSFRLYIYIWHIIHVGLEFF